LKTLVSIAVGSVVTAACLHGETLFGPGTINIATNEAILINTLSGAQLSFHFHLDGLWVPHSTDFEENPRYAIAGPRSVMITNSSHFITFQRLRGSSIQTVVTNPGTTNRINVPNGKTIQFFAQIGSGYSTEVDVFPLNSSNVYSIFELKSDYHPSLTGPMRIEVWQPVTTTPAVISYYLTDDVLQLPPSGLLTLPAPKLEVQIEKAYDLTNWVNTAVFNTEAEAKAFYRLRILK